MCWAVELGSSEGGSELREVKVPGKMTKPARRIPRPVKSRVVCFGGVEMQRLKDLQVKNEMYMLCIRGIVSRERSIFIYLVCRLVCLFKPVGLADTDADISAAVVEYEFCGTLRTGFWEAE